jgi:hypothetical protein
MEFRVSRLDDSSVFGLYLGRDEIWLDPPYQRMADIWPLEKKQLLIDSLLNGFDVPKFYFHDFYPGESVDGREVRFAIIDGKQRLSAIWDFIDGKLPLSKDIELLNQPGVDVRGLTYGELGAEFPRLKATLDARHLTVITIQTNDVELIEEMFSRLNEAVPLSAAEKRNAFRGPIPPIVRELSQHEFFAQCLPFSNSRYRYFDVACKFLYLAGQKRIVDLKKIRLDEFVIDFRDNHTDADAKKLESEVISTIARMAKVFVEHDPLLRQAGMVTLLFLLYAGIGQPTAGPDVTRSQLEAFDAARLKNRALAEEEETSANYELLEFDRYAQSPNDALALKFRYDVLTQWLAKAWKPKKPPS